MLGGSAAQGALLRAFFHVLHFAGVAGIDPLLESRNLREGLFVDRGDAGQIETGFGSGLSGGLRHLFRGDHVIPIILQALVGHGPA